MSWRGIKDALYERRKSSDGDSGYWHGPKHVSLKCDEPCASCTNRNSDQPTCHYWVGWNGTKEELEACSMDLETTRIEQYLLWRHGMIAEGNFLGQEPGFLTNGDNSVNFADFSDYQCMDFWPDEHGVNNGLMLRKVAGGDPRETVIYQARMVDPDGGNSTNLVGYLGCPQPGDELVFFGNTMLQYGSRPIITSMGPMNGDYLCIRLDRDVSEMADWEYADQAHLVYCHIWREAGSRPRFSEKVYASHEWVGSPPDWHGSVCAHCHIDPSGSVDKMGSKCTGTAKLRNGHQISHYCAMRKYFTVQWVPQPTEQGMKYEAQITWRTRLPEEIASYPADGPCRNTSCTGYAPLSIDSVFRPSIDAGTIFRQLWWAYDKGIEMPPMSQLPQEWTARRLENPSIMSLTHEHRSSYGWMCWADVTADGGYSKWTGGPSIVDYKVVAGDELRNGDFLDRKVGGFYVFDTSSWIGIPGQSDPITGRLISLPERGWIGEICEKYYDVNAIQNWMECWFPPGLAHTVRALNSGMPGSGAPRGVSGFSTVKTGDIWMPAWFGGSGEIHCENDLMRLDWVPGNEAYLLVKPLRRSEMEPYQICTRQVYDAVYISGQYRIVSVSLRCSTHRTRALVQQGQTADYEYIGAPGDGFPLPDIFQQILAVDERDFGSPSRAVRRGDCAVLEDGGMYPVISAKPCYSNMAIDPSFDPDNLPPGLIGLLPSYRMWGGYMDVVDLSLTFNTPPEMDDRLTFYYGLAPFLWPKRITITGQYSSQNSTTLDFSTNFLVRPEDLALRIPNSVMAQIRTDVNSGLIRDPRCIRFQTDEPPAVQ